MADDKTTPDAEGQVDGTDDGTDGKTGGDDGDTGDDGTIVFESQDALDEWLEGRLARDRRARRRKTKNKGDKSDKSTDKGDDKSGGEPNAATAQLQSDALKMVEAANRKAVEASALVAATEAGLPADRIRAAVKLADLEVDEMLDDQGNVDDKAVKAAINDAAKTYPFLKVADNAPATDDDDDATSARVGGKTQKPDGDKALDALTPERFAELSYNERVQLFNRDPQLYERLSNAAVAV